VRLYVVVLALALASCGTDDTTPSEPQGCIRLDGAYSLTYAEPACGRSGTITDRLVVINQSGCSVNAILPGYALLDGTVTGDTHLSGTARVTAAGGRITLVGTYGTSAPPPAGCACLASPGQGTLTLAM